MSKVNDILQDNIGDLSAKGGDLVIGDATYKHQRDLIQLEKGGLKSDPVSGVDLMSWILDENPGGLAHAVRSEFKADGMRVMRVSLFNGELKTKAKY